MKDGLFYLRSNDVNTETKQEYYSFEMSLNNDFVVSFTVKKDMFINAAKPYTLNELFDLYKEYS